MFEFRYTSTCIVLTKEVWVRIICLNKFSKLYRRNFNSITNLILFFNLPLINNYFTDTIID